MKHDDAQILSILEVIMRCTDLPSEEISSSDEEMGAIPLTFDMSMCRPIEYRYSSIMFDMNILSMRNTSYGRQSINLV